MRRPPPVPCFTEKPLRPHVWRQSDPHPSSSLAPHTASDPPLLPPCGRTRTRSPPPFHSPATPCWSGSPPPRGDSSLLEFLQLQPCPNHLYLSRDQVFALVTGSCSPITTFHKATAASHPSRWALPSWASRHHLTGLAHSPIPYQAVGTAAGYWSPPEPLPLSECRWFSATEAPHRWASSRASMPDMFPLLHSPSAEEPFHVLATCEPSATAPRSPAHATPHGPARTSCGRGLCPIMKSWAGFDPCIVPHFLFFSSIFLPV
jgi:hypothetical protein